MICVPIWMLALWPAVATGRAARDVTVELRGALSPVVSTSRAAVTEPAEVRGLLVAIEGFSGQPATAFPWGRTKGGLPIGLQAIGPYLEDRTTITFAALLEREFGGFTAPPGYQD